MEAGLNHYIPAKRERLGISATELAERVGMPLAYLSQIESGSRKWPKKYVGRLAQALGIPEVALAEAFASIPDWQAVERRTADRIRAHAPDAAKTRRHLERERDRLAVERDRLLVLYRRATIEVDRWEAEDRQLAARIDDVRARIARLPEPPSPEVLQATHRQLTALSDDVEMLAGFAPDRLAAIMRAHGITAQLHDGGVRLIWPESLRHFFET